MNTINPINIPRSLPPMTLGKPEAASGSSFKDLLLNSIKEVNTMQLPLHSW